MKLFAAAVFTFCAVFCTATWAIPLNWESRIVGGAVAGVGQFPYQVSLRTSANTHFCGGWVHNNRWIVSTAQCTAGRTLMNTRVVVAAHSRNDGTTHNSARIVNHPRYNANKIENDISCVQTTTVITFNPRVQPIRLGVDTIDGNVPAVVSGWGQSPGVGSADLNFLNTVTLSQADCRSRHGSNLAFIFDNTICTLTGVGQGACIGDTGGPVVAGDSVIGAVSWVIACGRGFPDVHARISSHRPWLLSAINA